MKRRHPHEAGALILAKSALRSLTDEVQKAVRSAARIAPISDRGDLIGIAWIISRTCDNAEHLHQALCSEARRMRTRRVEARLGSDEHADVFDICNSSDAGSVLHPHALTETVEIRDPEWYALAGEANESCGAGVNDIASIHSGEFSESILHAPSLARRMGISVRHARRYIKRWRQQDALWGDD